MGIYAVQTDDKDQATAEARLKTEKDTAPSMPRVEMDDGQGKPEVNLIRITAKQGQAIPENKGACGQVKQHTDLDCRNMLCWADFRYDMVHKQISDSRCCGGYQVPKPQWTQSGPK